jgi:hypothetical protein
MKYAKEEISLLISLWPLWVFFLVLFILRLALERFNYEIDNWVIRKKFRKGEKWRTGTPDQCLNNPCQAREALGVSNTSHGGSLENIPIGPCGICAMCDTSTIHNGLVRNEVAAQSLRAPSATSPLTSNEHVHAPAPPSPAWSLEGPARSVDLGGFLNFNPT